MMHQHCEHRLPISECPTCYPIFLSETSVGDVIMDSAAFGKSKAWRDAADKLLETLARDNQYIVADIVIIFLESAGYGLLNYSPLGGVFKRAAKRRIIQRVDRPTKQALWVSKINRNSNNGV